LAGIAWGRFLGGLLAVGLLATACALGGPRTATEPLRLKPADDEANSHLVAAMRLNNEVTTWMNKLGEPGVVSTGTLDQGELRTQVDNLSRALVEAKSVSPDFMARAHPQLPEVWRTAVIPSVEGQRDYYAASVTDPSAPAPPAAIITAVQLGERWGAWYQANRQAIREGIRRQAS